MVDVLQTILFDKYSGPLTSLLFSSPALHILKVCILYSYVFINKFATNYLCHIEILNVSAHSNINDSDFVGLGNLNVESKNTERVQIQENGDN